MSDEVLQMSQAESLSSALRCIPTVQQFYNGSSVFITGATGIATIFIVNLWSWMLLFCSGFLGKSIVEKLLRSCADLDRIFVLVRAKKGATVSERVTEMLNCGLFDSVKSEKGCEFVRSKIVAIGGDMVEEQLGICADDEKMLMTSNVTAVIHSAATIRFDEALKYVSGCMVLPGLKSLLILSDLVRFWARSCMMFL